MGISTERYAELLVEFLEGVGYNDVEDPDEELPQTLRHVFSATRKHFETHGLAQDRKRLATVIRTISRMTVFGWGNLPLNVMVRLNIYFTYVILEDDPADGSTLAHSPLMDSFTPDLLSGREQAHPRYRSLFSFLSELLRCYGPYSQLTMTKSNLELIQGFLIESRHFKGLPGATSYPMFLRRLNALGDFSGAALFPAAQFDERKQFEEIVTVIAQIEPVVALVNDLFSFYKEVSDPAGDVSLVENICATEGVGTEQVLRRIADEATKATNKLTAALQGQRSKEPLSTVHDFVRGYIRWHLCDERYRLRELVVPAGDGSSSAAKFRRFHEMACRAGCTDRVDFHAL